MAFKFGAFARGFAEAAVEDKREKEDEIKEIIKTSYVQSLEEAKELRKSRKAKREQLSNIGAQLKAMGLSDAQAAGILANGVEGAKNTLQQLQTTAIEYGKAGQEFDVNTFVSAANESNLTIDDAISRIMGTVKPAAGGPRLPSLTEQTTIFGDMSKFTERQLAQLQEGFGEDLATLQAEVAGEYEFGEVPSVTIDYARMGIADPTDALRKRALELEVALAEKKLEEDDDKATAMKSADLRAARKDILSELGTVMRIDLRYDEDSGNIISSSGTADQIALATQLASQGMELMQGFGGAKDYASAYNKTIRALIPMAGGTPTTTPTTQPSSSATTTTATTTTTTPTLPAYNPSQTPASYINQLAQQMQITGMGARAKANAKKTIVNQLVAGGMNPVDAQKEVNKIIK